MTETFDIIVIGGGIAGASAAASLAPLGRLLLIEREDSYGYHTTGRSAAMFTPTYGNAVIRAITAASRGFYYHPPDGFADHPLVSQRPTLTVALPDDWSMLQAQFDDFRRTSPEIELLDEASIRAQAPFMQPGRFAGAVIDPITADIDVNGIHFGFLAEARRAGAKTRPGVEVLSGTWHGQHWHLQTSAGDIEAGLVVNAAGAWGDVIAQRLGVRPLGLEPKRRSAFTFAPPAGANIDRWPMVIDAAETYYVKPDAGMILGSPCDATPSAPMDAWPDDMDVAEGAARIEAATIFQISRLAHSWAGLRTFAPDKTPVVGRDPMVPGFVWFVGQGGYGIQTAPAMSRIIASLIAHDQLPTDVADFGVDKASLSVARFRARA